jgi:anti-sigma B factor antagonist
MRYQHRLIKKVVVISIDEEELFSKYSNEVIETVKSQLEKGNCFFVVDLKKVKYLNSTGINTLIAVLTVVRNHEGELALAAISKKIESLLVITKLNSIFNVKGSVEEAIEFLNIEKKVKSNQS